MVFCVPVTGFLYVGSPPDNEFFRVEFYGTVSIILLEAVDHPPFLLVRAVLRAVVRHQRAHFALLDDL